MGPKRAPRRAGARLRARNRPETCPAACRKASHTLTSAWTNMDYEISPNNIQLKSSFEVRKADFERELSTIRARHPDSLVWNRSMDSLKREWAVHNAFHEPAWSGSSPSTRT